MQRVSRVGVGSSGIVPPYILEKLEQQRASSAKYNNGGFVPPHILEKLGQKPANQLGQGEEPAPYPPNGNGGVVPPYVLEKLEPETGCFPEVPTHDEGGIDVIFTDVILPAPKKKDVVELLPPVKPAPVPQLSVEALFGGWLN